MESSGDFTENVTEEITEILKPIIDEIKHKWHEIGESLGLSEAELPRDGDEEELLRQVITKWVEKSLGVNMWPPLLDALSKETTSNIISELRENYCRVVYTDGITDDGESELKDSNNHRDIVKRKRCQCHDGWHGFKLMWFDPALTCLLLAIGICAFLSVGEMDELDKYMSENPMDSDKWQELSARPIRILITGKTGTGKSALINGLVGKKVAKEGETLKPQTSKVEEFRRTVNGVPMKVFDSPGLQDGTAKEEEYMKDMDENCKDVDLILYTIKMSDTRVHEDDVQAMQKLTVAFTEEFWSKAILVLTFANKVQIPEAPGQHDYEKNYDYFRKKLQDWNNRLPEVLSKTLGISSDIASKVPIVPAGYYKVRDLPGCRFWFSQFWKTVIDRMMEINKNRTRFLLEYSKERWHMVYESSSGDFDEAIYKQNIVKQPKRTGWLSWS